MDTRSGLTALVAGLLLAGAAGRVLAQAPALSPGSAIALAPSPSGATTGPTTGTGLPPAPAGTRPAGGLEASADRGNVDAMVALIAHQLDVDRDLPYFDRYHRVVAQAAAAGHPGARILAERIAHCYQKLLAVFMAATRATERPDPRDPPAGGRRERAGEPERDRDEPARERDKDADREERQRDSERDEAAHRDERDRDRGPKDHRLDERREREREDKDLVRE